MTPCSEPGCQRPGLYLYVTDERYVCDRCIARLRTVGSTSQLVLPV
jgi:hypothetical protein